MKKQIGQLDVERRHLITMGSGLLWYLKAWEIKYSSDTLYRSRMRSRKKPYSVLSQELLLLGFAFELLFKSFYLAINKVEKLPTKMKTHSLEKLVVLAGIKSVKRFNIVLLKKLSNYIWWQGRYPCALQPQQNKKVEISKSEILLLRSLWRECCRQMPAKIEKEFIETITQIKVTKKDKINLR